MPAPAERAVAEAPPATDRPSAGRPVPVRGVRRPWRWVGAAVVLVLAALVVRSVATNPRFEWDVVGEYVFSQQLLDGAVTTLTLTVLCMAIGIVLGAVIAVMRRSELWLVRGAANSYVWFFRGTPVLVQIIFWFNLAALYPTIDLGLPGMDPWVQLDANSIITPMAAALLALGLNEAAYMSEIVRAGLLSVDDGQMEASQSLGMSKARAMRRIVLPQAMRVIIPPTGNETIMMLKTTALVSVVAVADLLYAAQVVYSTTFQTIPLLIAASLWYIGLTSVLSIGQIHLEKRYSRGAGSSETVPLSHRVRRVLGGIIPMRSRP